MSKLLFALSAASLCALNTIAQETDINQQLKKATVARTAGKTTGVESRLISYTWRIVDGGVQTRLDSTYYTYSPSRGWDLTLKGWKFDKGTGLLHNGNNYDERSHTFQVFDAQNQITEQYSEWKDSKNNWVNGNKTLYTYTAQRQLATIEEQIGTNTGWQSESKDIYAYDAQGRLTETVYQEIDATGTLVNLYRRENFYVAQGTPAKSVTDTWDAATGQWTQWHRTTYSYAGTLLTNTISEMYQGGSWDNYVSTTNTYDSNDQLIEQETKRNINSTWEIENKTIYVYDMAGNQISATYFSASNGAYKPSEQTTTSYNSLGQTAISTVRHWDYISNSFPADDYQELRYYYEPFTNGVKDVVAQAGMLRVFPIPASNSLTFDIKWNEMQGATAVLCDMNGRIAQQWTIPPVTQHIQSLDVSAVPPGVYMLKVAGAKDVLAKQVSIVR